MSKHRSSYTPRQQVDPVHVVKTVGDGSGPNDYKVVEPIRRPEDTQGAIPAEVLAETVRDDGGKVVEEPLDGPRPDPTEDHFFGTFFDTLRNLPSYGSSEFAVGPVLFSFVVGINAKTVIEIGRFTGFSTLALAGALRFLDTMPWSVPESQLMRPEVNYNDFIRNGDRLLVSIDPDNTYNVEDLLNRSGRLDRYAEFVYKDSHGLDLAAEGLDIPPADFVFIDGDHSLEGLRQDVAEYVGRYLKPGGYFALHDYFGWYQNTPDGYLVNGSAIKTVCDEIQDQYQHILIDTGHMSLMVFRKPLP